MEALFSAVLGELAARCLSFLISKYWATPPGLSEEESLRRLEWALLRVAVTVEDAEGRFITNAAMLHQLHSLRQEMHKGYYLLDRFRYINRRDDHRKVKHHHHNRSLAMSSASGNPGKHSPTPSATAARLPSKELKLMLDTVLNMVADMHEFVSFLKGHPRMCRQPYSMHLLLEKCVFGRHAEMERTVHFLLQREPPGECNLGVLPIVGQGKVGKTTFVEHVCYDVRVRDHFSQIVFFSGNNNKLRTEELSTFKHGGIIKHNNDALNEEKILVIVELDGDDDDIDDDAAWRRLFSSARSFLPRGSKIIITGRSEKLMNFGTTQALRLNFLSREACWYFFKVLVFGSTYPQDHHPELASLAMKIFEEYYSHTDMFGDFIGPFSNSKNIAGILRAKFSKEHWHNILACVKINGQKNHNIRMGNEQHYNITRLSNISQFLQVNKHHRVAFCREQAPKITIDEIMFGRITPKGKFEVVWWTSHLPPYYSYIASCEILDSECTHTRERFSKKRKIMS